MQSSKAPHYRILFAGEEPKGSSPSLTWAKAVAREGAEYRFVSDLSKIDLPRWISDIRWADTIVFQDYDGPSDYVIRQLALATVLGRPIVRKWSGTDALRCTTDTRFQTQARRLNSIVAVNLTEAEHTREELAESGIKLKVTPPNLDASPVLRADEYKPLALLTYLPSMRPEFYGSRQVRYAAERNPDICFVIVADDTHALSDLPNVKSLGWIDDMESIWPQVGGLLRLTEHDGLPRMLLDAMARGKYVLFSRPMQGTWHVTDNATLDAALHAFKTAKTINQQGLEAAQRLLRPDNNRKLLDNLTDAAIKPGALRQAKALWLSVRLTLKHKIAR